MMTLNILVQGMASCSCLLLMFANYSGTVEWTTVIYMIMAFLSLLYQVFLSYIFYEICFGELLAISS